MSGPTPSAGSNPLAGGSSANTPATNPLAGGSPNQTPAPSGQPAGDAGSNPPAGGSSEPGNIPPDVAAELRRENQALRKRMQTFEEEQRAAADAKLSEQERLQKQLADLQRKESDFLAERQSWQLKDAVAAQAGQMRLHDVNAAVTLLRSEFGDQMDYDEQGRPTNAPYLLGRLLEKYPWLRAPEAPAPTVPGSSGRTVSPGRQVPPPAAAQPVRPAEWPRLSDVPWTKPQ